MARWNYVIGYIVLLAFLGCLIVFMKDNPEELEKTLTIVIFAGLGAFGGYGFGKNSKD